MQPYPLQTKFIITLYRQRKRISARYFLESQLSEERLFSVIFMNIDLRKAKTENCVLNISLAFGKLFRTSFIMRDFFMNIGLRKVKEIAK